MLNLSKNTSNLIWSKPNIEEILNTQSSMNDVLWERWDLVQKMLRMLPSKNKHKFAGDVYSFSTNVFTLTPCTGTPFTAPEKCARVHNSRVYHEGK